MVTCPLTTEETAAIQEGFTALLTMTCDVRRPAEGSTPFERVGTYPCYLHLTSAANQETVTSAAHQDRVNAELLVPKGTPLAPNDVVHVATAKFVVRMIDPDDTGLIRALGRVER